MPDQIQPPTQPQPDPKLLLSQWHVQINAFQIGLQKILSEMTGAGRKFMSGDDLPQAIGRLQHELRDLQERIEGPQIAIARPEIVRAVKPS